MCSFSFFLISIFLWFFFQNVQYIRSLHILIHFCQLFQSSFFYYFAKHCILIYNLIKIRYLLIFFFKYLFIKTTQYYINILRYGFFFISKWRWDEKNADYKKKYIYIPKFFWLNILMYICIPVFTMELTVVSNFKIF